MPVGTDSVTWGYSGLCGSAVIKFPREKWTGNLVVDRSIVYFHRAGRLPGMFHEYLKSVMHWWIDSDINLIILNFYGTGKLTVKLN